MNVKKTIITAVASVIAIATVSVSFSLAWYATSSNLFIDTLNLEVNAEKDLKISTSPDIESFTKSHLDYDELNHVRLFKPVSSMFKERWMVTRNSEPVFYENIPLVNETTHIPYDREATWGYYAQHLYLLADDSVYVGIDWANTSIEPNVEENEKTAQKLHELHPEYTKQEIYDKLCNLKYSLRIGILDPDPDTYKFHIVDPFKDGDVLMGGRQDLGKDEYYDDYTNSSTYERYEIIFGEINNRDKAVYGVASASGYDAPHPEEELTSFNAKTDVDVHPFDKDKSLENGLTINKESSLSREETDKKLLLPVKSGQPKDFVLCIYMEGWDEDCVNHHMGGHFKLDLSITVLREI